MVEAIEIPDATPEPGAYVQALLATLGDRDAMAVYAETPNAVRRLCGDLTETAWSVPLAPREWNATQIVGHLFDVDVVYGFRWRLVLTDEEPAYPGYNEKAWAQLARPPAPLLLASFEALREANVELMQNLKPADWRRCGTHGEQGREDIRRMMDKIAGHDLAHLNQLERTLSVALA
jgi:hypothetical protein